MGDSEEQDRPWVNWSKRARRSKGGDSTEHGEQSFREVEQLRCEGGSWVKSPVTGESQAGAKEHKGKKVHVERNGKVRGRKLVSTGSIRKGGNGRLGRKKLKKRRTKKERVHPCEGQYEFAIGRKRPKLGKGK